MKKITFLFILAMISFVGKSQINPDITLFEDSFEDYQDFIFEDIGDWTFIDSDGLSTYSIEGSTFPNQGYNGSFIIFNPSLVEAPLDESPAWSARTGDKTITAFAGVPVAATANDDRLISPQITLGSSGNNLSFWIKAPTDQYGLEFFNVEISTTGTAVGDFSPIASSLAPDPEVWSEVVVNLDEFALEDVYISIRYLASDAYALIIDDFKVTATTLSNTEFDASNLNHFYNAGQLTIQSSFNLDNVSLYNALGQEVLTQALNSDKASVNVSSLSTGLYIAKVASGDQVNTFKFVKQ
jgi:hypothetical protein